MKLTIMNRLKLCYELLTIRSGYDHTDQEKQLSTFIKGYNAGMADQRIEIMSSAYDIANDRMITCAEANGKHISECDNWSKGFLCGQYDIKHAIEVKFCLPRAT